MRKEFSAWLKNKMQADAKTVFVTGDLGFQAFEDIKANFGERFINAGVAEQNMVMLAAGLANEGVKPICYSIAPFAVFRPYEQLRLDLGIHNMKVMIVGNGGGYGYGIMGATHHALEDLAALSTLPNFRCATPLANEDLSGAADELFNYNGPSYLRMGFGNIPKETPLPSFAPIRQLKSGDKFTLVGLGPVLLNALAATKDLSCDIFCVSELPLKRLTSELIASVKKTKKLVIVEEHVVRGGMGENLLYHLANQEIAFKLYHRHALGYPDKSYGSQKYHQRQCGMDEESLRNLFSEV